MATADDIPAESAIWGGRYETLEVLASHERTWLARCRDRSETFGEVSVKILRSASEEVSAECHRALGEEFLERSRIMTEQLRGLNLETVLDSGWDVAFGLPFIVRPFLPGVDLERWLSQNGRPDLRQGVHWMAQIAEQVSLAHERHVVHYDIKPQNVIITDTDQQARLIDFGEALTAADTVEKLYRTGVRGTRGYIAPEVLTGNVAGLDVAADVFSLGLLLFHVLTGQQPFHDRPRISRIELETESNGVSTSKRLVNRFENPPDITDREVPPQLRDLYLQCVRLTPSERPRAVEVARKLRRWLESTGQRTRFSPAKSMLALLSVGMMAVVLVMTWLWREPSVTAFMPENREAGFGEPWPTPGYQLLLKEAFDDAVQSEKMWEFKTPTITRLPMTAESRIDTNHLSLTNRGIAVLQTPIESAFAMEFDWMWVEGDGTYSDDLTVCIRSNCELNSAWPHEVSDGVTIRFSPYRGNIGIHDRQSNRALAGMTGLKMPRGIWHRIGITDHEQEVTVYFNDLAQPTLQVMVDMPAAGQQIGIYNREPVGRVHKRSLIDNVSVWVPVPRDGK